MDQGPTRPTDDTPDAEWGQRRRGNAPPPRASWEQAREEFERASQAWERHKSEAEAGERWEPPGAGPRATPGAGPDLSGLLVLLDTLRQAAPAELQERSSALIREVLMTLRSLIDWYLEHLDQPREKPTVEDIPIE